MTPKGPLAGIRVLDLSRILAGPFATQLLADLGATVIKVEHPRVPDDTRAWGPPFTRGVSAYFAAVNRGKRSLACDLKSPAGRSILERLVLQSDVVFENFLPGVAARLKVSAADLKAINPNAIVISITGFGSKAATAERPGFDFLIQAMSGLMSITGDPGGEPTKAGVALVDVITGLYAAVAALSALYARTSAGGTSQVQHCDISLMGAAMAAMVNVVQTHLTTGVDAQRYGNAHPTIVPYQTFPTRDGRLAIAVGTDAQFQRLMTALGQATIGREARFATNPQRVAHREELVAIITLATVAQTTGEWERQLVAAKVPCGPVNSVAEALAFWEKAQPDALVRDPSGQRYIGSPLWMNGHGPVAPTHSPPQLGADTVAVLDELGFSKAEVAAWFKQGAITFPD